MGFNDTEVNKYLSQIHELGIQRQAAQDDLDSFCKLAGIQKAEFLAGYDQPIMDLQNQIAQLKNQVSVLSTQIDQLNQEIIERTQKRDSVNLAFDNQQQFINEQLVEIASKMIDLSNRENAVIASEKQLDTDRNSWTVANALQDQELQTRLARVASVQTALDKVNADLAARKQEIENQEQILANRLNEVVEKEAELNNQTVLALEVLAQADEINQKSADAIDQLTKARTIALQNQDDITQINVAKLALANQQQDLNIRLAALKAAEQKVGG